ncbi:mitochondrial 54S ribosomal protein YmL20 [Corchorus olitorius]|uniref:Mitochondrial 54S ribosomal protein YmL20 n=1 Tax=Corchorus olitorius TaxID=93759 RepID=A0A1R3KA52_9ROSI|nr:mitochondrial 54S ribosomal protein YmL20 [Corchorus olitorius]
MRRLRGRQLAKTTPAHTDNIKTTPPPFFNTKAPRATLRTLVSRHLTFVLWPYRHVSKSPPQSSPSPTPTSRDLPYHTYVPHVNSLSPAQIHAPTRF